jgi:hypothetical protein
MVALVAPNPFEQSGINRDRLTAGRLRNLKGRLWIGGPASVHHAVRGQVEILVDRAVSPYAKAPGSDSLPARYSLPKLGDRMSEAEDPKFLAQLERA